MISIEYLKESIYRECYFSMSIGVLDVCNEDRPAVGTLSKVEMRSKGTFINLSNKLLKISRDIYQSADRDTGRISYCRDCDGICLLELDGRNILLFVEVKSGFNELKKKAFEQLVASYIKTRCILQSIKGYNPDDYEEMGIIISYPPTAIPTSSLSTSLIGIKSATIAPSIIDKLNARNVTALRVDQEVTLNLSDYKVDTCHVNPSLYRSSLHVKHISVTDLAISETIDLDSYL